MDTFAANLGVSFKSSKDVGTTTPLTALEFLGISISTLPSVSAYPSATKLANIRASITESLSRNNITFESLEELIGKLSFIAQVHALLKVSLTYLYTAFHANTPLIRPTKPSSYFLPIAPFRESLNRIFHILSTPLLGASLRPFTSSHAQLAS